MTNLHVCTTNSLGSIIKASCSGVSFLSLVCDIPPTLRLVFPLNSHHPITLGNCDRMVFFMTQQSSRRKHSQIQRAVFLVQFGLSFNNAVRMSGNFTFGEGEVRLFLSFNLVCGGENYVALSDRFHSFFVNFVWWYRSVDRTSGQFYNTNVLHKRQEAG